jgi:hypothetical protein
MRKLCLVTLCLAVPVVASAQGTMVFVAPTDDGFHTYITAAIQKKKVPVSIVASKELATHTLTASQVKVENVTTGKRVVNCLFAYCAGNEDKASTSVTLTDNKAGTIVWSYAVNKGRGTKNMQSMAEAIAKHLKDEYASKLH